MPFLKSLFVVAFLLLPVVLPAAPPPVIEEALIIKKEVDAQNKQDLIWISDAVQKHQSELNSDEATKYLANVRARLLQDKARYRAVKQEMITKKISEAALSSSLTKLIGVESPDGTVLYSGIIDDAVKLLDAGALSKDIRTMSLERNQITVSKTLLLYALVELLKDSNLSDLAESGALEKNVQLLYPIKTPAGLDTKEVEASCLGCGTGNACRILVPNAGYIYGGNFVEGQCRGIDCSAFVSKCADARTRMSTLYLDMLWREIREGEKAFSQNELPIREEMIRDYQLKESTKDFEAIDPTKDKLQPGDLVTWRNTAGGGHTVIYLQGIEVVENEFVGIETNREDNKSKEGIEINTFKLLRGSASTSVLRRLK